MKLPRQKQDKMVCFLTLGSVHTELLAIALALVGITKNGCSIHFFGIAKANAIIKAQCERDLSPNIGLVISFCET